MSAFAFKNARVVRSSWLEEGGRRLDCNPYMSGALEARDALKRLSAPKEKLVDVTFAMFDSGRHSRNWVDDPNHGVRYMGSSAISLADLSALPLISNKQVARSPKLLIEEGWSLITRSGTIGRMAYVRSDMAGLACSEDVLRVVPDPDRIPPGYLYAYLSSRYGVPLVVSGTYGAIIQHIEPEHIAGIEVPRLGSELEAEIDRLIRNASELRAVFQSGINEATKTVLKYAGVEDCPPHKWNALQPDIGFSSSISVARSMRAANYSPRVQSLLGKIKRAGSLPLGEICKDGHLGTGARFKRIDCEPSEGVRLVGQKQGFWMQPEGRWISPRHAPKGIFAADESVLVASSGTLGENEVYCRPILITGRWLDYAFTQHFLRVVSGDDQISGAYLFAFLRSEIAFRALRSMSTGSKQQEIHNGWLYQMPIPVLTDEKRTEVEEIIRTAFKSRDQADVQEGQAVAKVEAAIGGVQ